MCRLSFGSFLLKQCQLNMTWHSCIILNVNEHLLLSHRVCVFQLCVTTPFCRRRGNEFQVRYTCASTLSTSSKPPLPSKCILGIETSFKMAVWDQFAGQWQEDGGERRQGCTQWRTEKSPRAFIRACITTPAWWLVSLCTVHPRHTQSWP